MSRIEGERTLHTLLGILAVGLSLVSCREAADASRETAPSHEPSPTPAPEPKSAGRIETSVLEPPPTSPSDATSVTGSEVPPANEETPRLELPRGGREIFPAHRIVGFCGTPGAPALGRLAGNLNAKTKQVVSYAEKYARGRKVLPVFELIAVVVQGAPGNDGKWRRRVPASVVDDYLKAARAAKGLLLLNIQPGHSDFLTEAKAFEKYLRQPDVGLALDPEWAMKGKQKPGAVFGQTTGSAINEVAAYMSSIVQAGDLPEKVLVFHQVNGHVLKDESVLAAHPGVVLVKSVDGLGPKGSKVKTYNFLVKTMPRSVHPGFKLFFDEDKTNGGRLMSPEDVLRLTPEPEYVMYE